MKYKKKKVLGSRFRLGIGSYGFEVGRLGISGGYSARSRQHY